MNKGFRQVLVLLWFETNQCVQGRIQDFPRGGAPISETGAPTYFFANFLLKTAGKWKNLDQEGACPWRPTWIHHWRVCTAKWFILVFYTVCFFPNKFEGSLQLNSRPCNAAIWNINFKTVFRNDQINPSRYLDNPLKTFNIFAILVTILV